MGTPDNSMASIFFEKQEAQLCAQHALNMLLQKDLFTPVDLAEIANRLDREENAVLDAGHKESMNMDDSGFFSVQVIAEALKTFKLELISILHPGVEHIKKDPLRARAFICNRSEHWFVIRKFGQQWFELNSCRTGAILHTDTYVSLLLTQLTNDGYSIFVIEGALPDCVADKVIAANPVKFVPPKRKEKKKDDDKDYESKEVQAFSGAGARLGGPTTRSAGAAGKGAAGSDEDELEEAIRRSLDDHAGPSHSTRPALSAYDEDLRRAMELSTEDDSEDRSFQMALAMSMEGDLPSSSAATAPAPAGAPMSAIEEARVKREGFLKRFE